MLDTRAEDAVTAVLERFGAALESADIARRHRLLSG